MSAVTLVEVGPRDGLQNESLWIPTATKIQWINLLSECGFPIIEATSFVSPQWIPQMADAKEVFSGIRKNPRTRYPVLVPNEKGLRRALDLGVKDIAVFVAASETFSQKNTHCSIAESFLRLEPIFALAQEHQLSVRAYISCVINCPYEGKIAPKTVAPIARTCIEKGCYEVSLGDTTGKAFPEEVRALLTEVLMHVPAHKLAGHFHDTASRALENIAVAFDEFDVTTFDASTAGIGGCPYAPGARGNVASEKVVDFFEQRNIATGIHQGALLKAKAYIQQQLLTLKSP